MSGGGGGISGSPADVTPSPVAGVLTTSSGNSKTISVIKLIQTSSANDFTVAIDGIASGTGTPTLAQFCSDLGVSKVLVVSQSDVSASVDSVTGFIEWPTIISYLSSYIDENAVDYPQYDMVLLDFTTPFVSVLAVDEGGTPPQDPAVVSRYMIDALNGLRAKWPAIKWAYANWPTMTLKPGGHLWTAASEGEQESAIAHYVDLQEGMLRWNDFANPSAMDHIPTPALMSVRSNGSQSVQGFTLSATYTGATDDDSNLYKQAVVTTAKVLADVDGGRMEAHRFGAAELDTGNSYSVAASTGYDAPSQAADKVVRDALSIRPAFIRTLFVYDDTAPATGPSAGDPVFIDPNTDDWDIDPYALMAWLNEQGVDTVMGGPGPVYVVLDLESRFHSWITGSDPAKVNEAVARAGAAVDVVKAEYGDSVRIGFWGLPRVVSLTSWRSANTAQREAQIQKAVTDMQPLMDKCDFIMPSIYCLSPDSISMDPSTREFEVFSNPEPPYDTLYPNSTLAQQEIVYTDTLSYVRGGLEMARRLKAGSSNKNIRVIPSFSPMFSDTVTSWAFQEIWQFVPMHLCRRWFSELADYLGGFDGFNLWFSVDNKFDNAFYHTEYNDPVYSGTFPGWSATSDNWYPRSIQVRMRESIVQTFYGGVSPIPGDAPDWNAPLGDLFDHPVREFATAAYNDRLDDIAAELTKAMTPTVQPILATISPFYDTTMAATSFNGQQLMSIEEIITDQLDNARAAGANGVVIRAGIESRFNKAFAATLVSPPDAVAEQAAIRTGLVVGTLYGGIDPVATGQFSGWTDAAFRAHAAKLYNTWLGALIDEIRYRVGHS